MKKIYLLLFFFIAMGNFAQNVTITKVIETGCSDPFVKSVELYVDGTVNFANFGSDGIQNTADDEVILNYMLNGNPWADAQIDISSLGTVTDQFVYIVRDIPLMMAEFPNTTFTALNTVVTSTATNGDDGYQIVLNGTVVSQFGKTQTDADNDTDSNWNHNDAVATRKDGIPDLGLWDPSHWEITAENVLDDFTNCQDAADPKTKNLETYFATLGSTFSLGSGSGWTPTGATCTTVINSITVLCSTTAGGATDDTYTAALSFSGGNTGTTFVISASSGTVSGDSPSSTESGTITISGIAEATDITVTISNMADGGVCNLVENIESPACVPLIINEVLFDPASDITGDANGDGTRDAVQDEFIEFFNNSSTPLDISGYTIEDGAELRHTFPTGTIILANQSIVVFGGGTPTGSFGGALIQLASEGQLNLSNGGDVITVKSNTGDIALVYNSSTTGINHGSNQSITRSPDITGNFVLHTDANASLLFSPGLKLDGTVLAIKNSSRTTFSVYPNPITKNNVYVTISSTLNDDIEVTIFNVLGKQLMTQKAINNQINISTLNNGVYLLKISQGESTAIKKLIRH